VTQSGILTGYSKENAQTDFNPFFCSRKLAV
jgi:hypothetical protein